MKCRRVIRMRTTTARNKNGKSLTKEFGWLASDRTSHYGGCDEVMLDEHRLMYSRPHRPCQRRKPAGKYCLLRSMSYCAHKRSEIVWVWNFGRHFFLKIMKGEGHPQLFPLIPCFIISPSPQNYLHCRTRSPWVLRIQPPPTSCFLPIKYRGAWILGKNL